VYLDFRQLSFDLCELVVGQLDVGGAQALLDAFQRAGAGMGTMKSFLCSIHANEICAGRDVLAVREVRDEIQQGLVRADVLLVKSGDDPPHIVTGLWGWRQTATCALATSRGSTYRRGGDHARRPRLIW
jgi:hypothetical protein